MPPSSNPPDLRQELLAAFEVEYRDHLTVVRAGLAAARRGERADLRDIFRRLHSLKGAARAVDLTEVEQLAHELEAQMASVIEGGSGLSRDRTNIIEAGLDRVEAAIETALGGTEVAASDPDTDETAHGHLRVEAGQVTDLVIATTQLAQAIERHDGLGERISGIEAAIRQARRALDRAARRGEGDADLLEATSELASASRQASVIRHDLRDSSWALDAAFHRVREDVDRMSLVPAETIFGPMGRMVRDIARDEGVQVDPEFLGLGLSADRRVLQALKDPVLQLLRNAVGHGSEPPARRRARGLPPATRITLLLQGGGGTLTATVRDDGPGPDLATIRARAMERGLLSAAAAEAATEDRLLAMVFEPGFSTRTDVGPLSGRGMGLSIVAEAARALGGSARMRFADGAKRGGRPSGTAVEITVPLAVARQSAVLLGFAAVTVALPAASVLRLLRVPFAAIEPVGGQMCVRTDGPASAELAPVAVLGHVLGMAAPSLPVQEGHVKLAVIQGGAHRQRLALAVDHFSDVRRFLSHKADFVGVDPDLVAGLVMVTSEMPAALLSPEGILDRWARRGGWSGETGAPERAVTAAPGPQTILVVDDSITSRTLEKSILEAHGYRVMVAVDGVEALDILRRHNRPGGDHGKATDEATDTAIDMVLADVEMPRMDGFTLLQTMKDDPSLRTIPVIIMTSRDTAGDVRRGLDLGASAYIAKQSFDQQDLLGAIRRLL
ncbi:MAG TPA: response regulator [Acidisoma sp.]|uniref:hybrid sensor histidine kinase/response regulator n=1 Tax=Acidisoma sp. TaxID=1872115 RepID=UPI002B74E88E|nr:response regulator [Acidisoma sp.]HTI02473.1 response regulator [Acidisoma sp.]